MTKVMIADDEAFIRKGLMSLIDWNALGCEVVFAAANGRQVVEHLESDAPDIIISDIKMPVMDGIELAKYLQEHPAPMGRKLILLTAFADFEYARAAIQYSVSDYVTKDGDMDVIAAAVQRCKKQLAEEREAAGSTQDKISVFVKNVLDGTLFDTQEILSRAEPYALFSNGYCVVCATLSYKRAVSDSELVRLREHASRFFREEFSHCEHIVLPTGRKTLAVVLGGVSTAETVSRCRELCGAVAGLTELVLHTGVSAVHRSPTELPAAHREAIGACDLHFYSENCIHAFPERVSPSAPDAPALLDTLHEALRSGNTAVCEKRLSQLFAHQKDEKTSPAEVRRMAHTLFAMCHRALTHVGAAAADHGYTEQSFAAAVESAVTFEETCALQRALVQDTCRVAARALATDTNLITGAQHYISMHFSEPITLSGIAAAVGANPSYLSRAFKQKTGASIVDTITQMRMERAKQLIAQGALKIYEVSAAVGIDDAAYFSNVFHKYTGMYPKAYEEFLLRSERTQSDAGEE